MLVLALTTLAAMAGCPFEDRTSPEQASASLDAVDRAGEDDLSRIAQAAVTAVDCLGEPASAPLAARYHLAFALWKDAFGNYSAEDRDNTVVVPHLSAAYGIDSELRHANHFAPKEHFSSLAFRAREFDTLAEPVDGALFFDGTQGVQRPTTTATLFQRTDSEGKVVVSEVLYPGDSVPTYEAQVDEPDPAVGQAPPAEPVAMGTDSGSSGGSLRKPLRATGIALGAGALAVFGANAALFSGAMNPDTSTASNARSKKGLVNALGASAIVLGVGASGTFGASFVVE